MLNKVPFGFSFLKSPSDRPKVPCTPAPPQSLLNDYLNQEPELTTYLYALYLWIAWLTFFSKFASSEKDNKELE